MDIILTWPKKRSLDSYLGQVKKANELGLPIFFKVSQAPTKLDQGDRCYMVHDGAVRGWLPIVEVTRHDKVIDPHTGDTMKGIFVVREPEWHPLKSPSKMAGFRGFRYAENYLGD